jgi:hypothetical protein
MRKFKFSIGLKFQILWMSGVLFGMFMATTPNVLWIKIVESIIFCSLSVGIGILIDSKYKEEVLLDGQDN